MNSSKKYTVQYCSNTNTFNIWPSLFLTNNYFCNRYGGRRRSYGRRRYGRSVEDETSLDEEFLRASIADIDDCAKSFVCQVNAKSATPNVFMDEVETTVSELFGEDGVIDVSAPTAEFDLAATMGRMAGFQQCKQIYARCKVDYKTLRNSIESMVQPNTVTNNV